MKRRDVIDDGSGHEKAVSPGLPDHGIYRNRFQKFYRIRSQLARVWTDKSRQAEARPLSLWREFDRSESQTRI